MNRKLRLYELELAIVEKSEEHVASPSIEEFARAAAELVLRSRHDGELPRNEAAVMSAREIQPQELDHHRLATSVFVADEDGELREFTIGELFDLDS